MTAQTDIVLEPSPFGIFAQDMLAPTGYSYTFCYSCTAGTFAFIKDSITVTQNALDCSMVLTDVGFNPAAIPYNSMGSAVTIATDYNSIWAHS